MLPTRATVCLFAALVTGACGTSVPDLQEYTQTEVAGEMMVQSIVMNVTCEVQDAVLLTYGGPEKAAARHLFLDNWGAQVDLTLTVEEKSSASPSLSWLPNKVFTLATGAGLSADATRIDKVSSYFTVDELKHRRYCIDENRPGGLLLMGRDLKLKEWLHDTVTATLTGAFNYGDKVHTGPLKQTVLSHHVKFEVLSNANLTPQWKISRVLSFNPTGTFFTASRDRTHDLVVTLGPTDGANPTQPSRAAADAALASGITVGVGNAFRSALQQQQP